MNQTMQKLVVSKSFWRTVGKILLGFLFIYFLKIEPVRQGWGKFVVQMPILSGLILPFCFYAFIWTHKLGLFLPPAIPDHRVLLVRSETILNEGLYRLLNRQPHLVLATITTANQQALQAEIDAFAPDTVVITDLSPDTLFVHLLDQLYASPTLRLVRVGLENDLVQIYEKNQILIQQLDDFATVIQGKERQTSPKSMMSKTF